MKNFKHLLTGLLLGLVFSSAFGVTRTVTAGSSTSLYNEWDNLESGDVLYIPNGTYTITGQSFYLISKSNVVINGQSRDGVIVDFAGYSGFLCRGSSVVFQNMTIKGAKNSAVTVKGDESFGTSGVVSFDNIKFQNNGIGSDAAGAISYRIHIVTEGRVTTTYYAWPLHVKDCLFYDNVNNSASYGGGAISVEEAKEDLVIERNVFRGNQAQNLGGSAIFIYDIVDGLDIINNVFYDNTNQCAVYLEDYSGTITSLNISSNTFAHNTAGGIKFVGSFGGTNTFKNNMIVDNTNYDLLASTSLTFTGDNNIVESASSVTISGSNNDIGTSASYFNVVSNELDYTNYGADVAIAKISSGYPSLDAYGEARDGMYCDIGGLNVPLDTLTLWTGAANSHSWTNSGNWYRGHPANSTSFKRVDIFPVSSSNYPDITSNTSLTNVRFKVLSESILKNSTTMTCKSILVESDDNGDGQFIDAGNMTVSGGETYEQQLIAGQWNFLGVPYNVTAGNLLPNHTLNTDYWLAYYDGNNRANQGMVNNWVDITGNSDVLEAKKGYIIWVDSDITVSFTSRPSTETVGVTKHTGVGGYNNEGWNLVGNPYSIALSSDDVITDNSGVIRGAVYVYNSTNNNYDTRVGGVGSATYIPGHQAFFMQADASTNFSFETSAALYSTAYQFKSTELKSYVALKVNDDKGNKNETHIRVESDATRAFDGRYDAYEFVTSADLLVYSHLDGIDYSVNTFNLDETGIELPLRLQMKNDVERFSMTFTASAFEDYTAMLYDKEMDRHYMVVDGDSMVFNVGEEDVKSRFELRLSNNVVTKHVNSLSHSGVKVLRRANGMFVDVSALNSAATVRVVDVSGRVVYDKSSVSQGVDVALPTTGLYLVCVQSGDKNLEYKYMYR